MKTYSEKEKLIFGGVLKLFMDGNDLSGIKTQQIADAAGIGKSTIYEYFDSKNNVISQTIIYAMDMHIEKLKLCIESEDSFKNKMISVMKAHTDNILNINLLFNTVSAFGSAENFKKQAYDNQNRAEIERIIADMLEMYTNLLKLGQAEGIINLSFGREYVEQVFQSVMGGIMRPDMCCQDEEMRRKRIENAYSILVKALN